VTGSTSIPAKAPRSKSALVLVTGFCSCTTREAAWPRLGKNPVRCRTAWRTVSTGKVDCSGNRYISCRKPINRTITTHLTSTQANGHALGNVDGGEVEDVVAVLIQVQRHRIEVARLRDVQCAIRTI
jgi:hypothetical protein